MAVGRSELFGWLLLIRDTLKGNEVCIPHTLGRVTPIKSEMKSSRLNSMFVMSWAPKSGQGPAKISYGGGGCWEGVKGSMMRSQAGVFYGGLFTGPADENGSPNSSEEAGVCEQPGGHAASSVACPAAC